MNKSVFYLVLSIVLVCLLAGAYGFLGGNLAGRVFEDQWSPRNYVANDGECFVPPQGDPLYDEHYAQNVNVPNCDSLKTQSEAQYIDAQARNVIVETNKDLFYLVLLAFVFSGVVAFFVYAIAKGGGAPTA